MPRFIIIVIALCTCFPVWAKGRSELSRYYLLRDRTIAARDLYRPKEAFLSVDLILSSGVKDLISEVDDATGTGSSLQQTLEINKLLLKNANTERYIDADVALAIPLPYIKIKKTRILPHLFFGANLGASLSVSSHTGDPNDVELQAYAKKEIRYGVGTKVRFKPKETWDISLTQLKRADLYESRDATTIATSGDLVDLDGIDKNESTWRLALGFTKDNAKDQWFIRVSEIKIDKGPGHEKPALYDDNSPFWHLGFARKILTNWGEIRPFVGFHYRERYGVDDGLYIGAKAKLDSAFPMALTAMLDNQFFQLAPSLETKFFHFRYGIKTPYRNPQSDLWVSTIHQISLTFPFP